MTVTLAPLTRSDFDRVAHIQVAEDQIVFAGTVREAVEADEIGVDFYAILEAGVPVGFFKIDRGYSERYPFCQPGELGLRAYIVDLAHQGRGLGSAAVRAMPSYLPAHYPGASSLALTVNLRNPAARAAYLKGGFEDTGEIWPHGQAGPQNILRLRLGATV